MGFRVGEATCGWTGCNRAGEAKLDGRLLCRDHFYRLATGRLEEHRRQLKRLAPVGDERAAISQFLSELIAQATALVTSARFLSPQQGHQLFVLSQSAAELNKRVQRSPRMRRNMPILLYRETDPGAGKELTTTVDVSKRGASTTTSRLWTAEEVIWIETPGNGSRAKARVAWVKKNAPLQFLIGLEILDSKDFWELEKAPEKQKR